MSEFLVPIAISSQLDATGEERIHAAKYSPVARVSYTREVALLGNLPDMAVGDTVDFQYTFIPPVPSVPVTFHLVGQLPDGLGFNEETATVSGTATTAEFDNSWTIVAVPTVGDPVELDDTAYVLDIVGDPPDSTDGASYSYTFTGIEGIAPYSFVHISGEVPNGTALDSGGELAGTIDGVGSYTFSITMTDDAGVDITRGYTVNIDITYGDIYVGTSFGGPGNRDFTTIDGDTLTVSNVTTFTDQMLWPVVNADNTRVYHYVNNTLRYTQLSDHTIHDLTTGAWFNGGPVLLDSTETYLYAPDFDFGRLRKIQVSDGTIISNYNTSANCSGICWKDEDKEIIYLCTNGFDLRVFNTLSGSFSADLPGPGYNQYRGIGVSSISGYVYSCPSDSGVTGYLVEFHPLLATYSAVALPSICYDLAITPDGAKAFCVNNATTGRCYVVRLSDLTVIATINTGAKPVCVRINNSGDRAYVSCTDSNEVYVIDTSDHSVIDTVSVGSSPHGLAIYQST